MSEITYKDISTLSQKSSVAGTEKLPVSSTEYITPSQIVSGKQDTISDIATIRTQAASGSVAHSWVTANSSSINTATSSAHSHTNKAVLDGITAAMTSSWQGAATNSHTHSNKAVLDGISAANTASWKNVATTVEASSSSWSGKQDALSSGVNIKTINSESILGSGNLVIQGGSGGGMEPWEKGTGTNAVQIMGNKNTASGDYSIAAGSEVRAIGPQCFVFGRKSLASGDHCVAMGFATTASGNACFTHGESTKAIGWRCHAEGLYSEASGTYSHAEGYSTITSGSYSHAEGGSTITYNDYEHAEGRYNKSTKTSTTWGDANTLLSVGIGADSGNRKNALEILQSGKLFVSGVGGYNGANMSTAQTLQQVVAAASPVTISTDIVSDRTSDAKAASPKAVYTVVFPATSSTQGSGMAPNKIYHLGTLSGNTTFTLANPTDATVTNHYYWTFTTPSTAPTITWPSGISWYGGNAPTIAASKHYEVSVLNNIAICMEV